MSPDYIEIATIGEKVIAWGYDRDGELRQSLVVVDVGAVRGTLGKSSGADRATEAKEGVNGELSALRSTNQSDVLRSPLHGSVADGPDQSSEREEQSPAVGQDGEGGLRGLRDDAEPSRPSSGPQSPEQCRGEFADLMRFLPQASALAELRCDRHSAEVLRALRQAFLSAGAVSDPFVAPEAAWASLGEEAQDRIRLAFGDRFQLSRPFPLAPAGTVRNRVGTLRGAGNAICLAQAQAFVEAVIDIRSNSLREAA